MTVRPASPEDAPRLAVVHIRSWQAAYAEVFNRAFLDGLDIAAREKWFNRIIKQGAPVLVCERHGEPAGFCVADRSRDGEDGEIYSIYAHPDWWGSGVGHELIEAGEASLRAGGFERGHLWVLEANQRARDFYEAHGWEMENPIRLEEIGGVLVTERRYAKDL